MNSTKVRPNAQAGPQAKRTCRWLARIRPGTGYIEVTMKADSKNPEGFVYAVTPLEGVGFGPAFELEKVGSGEAYHVNLHGHGSCDCLGHERHGHCKHRDVMSHLGGTPPPGARQYTISS